MRTLVLLLALAACGGGAKQQPVEDDTLPDPGTASPGNVGGETSTDEEPQTELQRRQDAACERVIPRLTACAVADARAKLTPAQYKKEQIDETAPIHTRENLRKCKASTLSSRQVRVYEVCDREESECEPLIACLDNLKPKQ